MVKQKLLEDIGLWIQLQLQYYWSRYDNNFTVTQIVNCHQRHQPNMLFKQMSRTDYWPNDLVWLTKVDPTLTQSSALPIKHHSFQEISSLSKTDPCVGKIFRDPPQWSYLQKWIFNISFLGSLLNAHSLAVHQQFQKWNEKFKKSFSLEWWMHHFDIYNRAKSLCHLIYCKSNAIPNLKYASR